MVYTAQDLDAISLGKGAEIHALLDRYLAGEFKEGQQEHPSFAFARFAEALQELGIGYGSETATNTQVALHLDYVNMGDTYALTLCRLGWRVFLSSFGDAVEKLEAQGIEFE